MSEEDKEKALSRRRFLQGLGTGAAVGVAATSGIATVLKPPAAEKTTTVTVSQTSSVSGAPLPKPQRSGVIEYSHEKCVGCERCVLACALVHEGAASINLSRIMWREEYIKERIQEPMFCRQCDDPECYWACPKRDQALCIDKSTGARYINADECVGCQSCIRACPLTPSRIGFDPQRKVSFKCDLCKDRQGGPVCVEVCSEAGAGKALTLVTSVERK